MLTIFNRKAIFTSNNIDIVSKVTYKLKELKIEYYVQYKNKTSMNMFGNRIGPLTNEGIKMVLRVTYTIYVNKKEASFVLNQVVSQIYQDII